MTEKTYKIAIGPVTAAKLPKNGDWQTFNGAFQNLELTASEIAIALYAGRPITTWHKNNWRDSSNYICGQHLGIDCDTEDERSTIPHLLSIPLVADYGSILHTTPSHTPEKPRARVVFLLDTPIMQAANYTNAATALLWSFGAAADTSCKDASRFFYGCKPHDADIRVLDYRMPIVKIQEIIKTWQTATAQETQKRRIVPPSRYQRPDLARLADALRSINPWSMPYEEWAELLMAIHSEFPGDDGLSVATEWGEGEGREVSVKWRSFKQEGNTTGKRSVGSIIAEARRNGWIPKPTPGWHFTPMRFVCEWVQSNV